MAFLGTANEEKEFRTEEERERELKKKITIK